MTAKIKLNSASGGGSVSIQAPSSSSNNRVFALPDSADGTILTTTNSQVLQTVKTDTFSVTGTATADVTGLSVAITPSSSSSKILVSYNLKVSVVHGGYAGFIFLLRDSTQIYLGDAAGSRTRASSFMTSHASSDYGAYEMFDMSGSFLDSPSTTSATTYKIQMRSNNSSRLFYLNRHPNDGDAAYAPRTASSITVQEVAA